MAERATVAPSCSSCSSCSSSSSLIPVSGIEEVGRGGMLSAARSAFSRLLTALSRERIDD